MEKPRDEQGRVLHGVHARWVHRRRAQLTGLALRDTAQRGRVIVGRLHPGGRTDVHGPDDIRVDAPTPPGPPRWSRAVAGVLRRPPAWVFTHRTDLPTVVGADIRFVQGDVRSVYDDMRATREGDVWIIGGGDLVGQFDDAGLLDRVILGVCPVTLGAGAPLLPRRITSKRMRVADVRQEGQQVRIVLDVDRKT